MGTVKYTGPVASFHCPTNAEIRSLKVHFSPKQEGSGDPSPSNVRPIVGWDGVEVKHSHSNLLSAGTHTRTQNGITFTYYQNGDVHIEGTATKDAFLNVPTSMYFSIKPGKYTLSGNVSNSNVSIYIVVSPANGGDIGFRVSSGSSTKEITFTDDSARVQMSVGTGRTVNVTVHPRLEMGDFTELDTTEYEFGVLGKNKLDVSGFIDGEYVKSDGSIAQNSEFRRTDYLHLTPSDYIYSATKTDGTTAYVRVCGYDRSKAFVSQLGEQVKGSGNYEMAFTIPENVYYIILQSYKANTNEQIELGSTATTYEPYNPNHTVYGGWVDLITGEVREEWGEYIFTGDENIKVGSWNTGGYTDGQFYRLTYSNGADGNPFCNTTTSEETKCNILKPVASSYYGVKAGNISVLGKNDGVVYRYIVWGKSGFGDTAEDCVSKLRELYNNGTPLTVVSKLADPYINTYTLAPTQLQTFLGQNNVWSNADYVEVEYDLHETQDLLNRRAFIIANQPHVVKPVAAPLQNFVTDLAAPLKECKVHFSPVQDGTGNPSPDNVRPITGWTGVNVERRGKNLFDAEKIVSDSNNERTYIADGFLRFCTGTIRLAWNDINLPCPLRFSGRAKNFSIDGVNTLALNLYFSNGRTSTVSIKSQIPANSAADFSVTIGNSGDVLSSITSSWTSGREAGFDLSVTQLELGLTATTYEPYNGTTLPIDWSSAGTVYGGTLNVTSGELVVNTVAVPITPDTISNRSEKGYACVVVGTVGYVNADVPQICNVLPKVASASSVKNGAFIVYNSSGYNRAHISFCFPGCYGADAAETRSLNTAKVTELIESGTTPIVVFGISEPQTYELTPIEIKTLRGTNNVWSNSNGNLEIAYWTH